MADEDDRRMSDLAPTGPRGTVLLVLRLVTAVASVLTLLCGVALCVASGLWLVDLEQEPREPPGQIVALIPLAGAAVGAALGLIGVVGLALAILSQRLAGRRRHAELGDATDRKSG